MAVAKKAVGKFGGGRPAGKRPASTGPKPQRPGTLAIQAPEDFKPHFLLVQVRVEKDGLLGTDARAIRFQGSFAWDAEDKKKFDLNSYDAKTFMGVVARLAAGTFKATKTKFFSADPKARATAKGAHRLPKGVVFSVLIRVGRKAADNTLTAGVKRVFQSVKSVKTGRVKQLELEKTDPAYRMFRRTSMMLPVAFKAVQQPPKRGRARREVDTDEE